MEDKTNDLNMMNYVDSLQINTYDHFQHGALSAFS